ncbi:MAG: flippase-like domain-containing protein [Flavobacteriales bacterium]|nr:flippase-like domain-containing protein [Flavobacteriales bacterium]
MKSPMKSAFSGWKITLAVVLGLLISSWMVYRAVSSVNFVEVKQGTGTHSWIDGNQNKEVDVHDEADFQQDDHGNYAQQTVSVALNQIEWSNTTWFWLAGALLFMVGRDFFYMVRIRLLTKNKLNWKAAFYVIMIWEFASALSPGVVGGAAVAMFILNRETIPFGKATAIVVITAFMDNLFYVLMIPFVFLFIQHSELFPEGDSQALVWWFWGGYAIIFSVSLLLYLTIFWYPKLATRFLLFIFRLPFLKRWSFIAKEWGKDIEIASEEFKEEKRSHWIKVFLATCGSWISRYLVINAIMNAFLDLGFIENMKVLGKQLVLWLFMLVTPTPGGSGVAEYAFGELLGDFGATAILLAGMAILWRLISYFPYLFIGAIVLPSWIKRTRN